MTPAGKGPNEYVDDKIALLERGRYARVFWIFQTQAKKKNLKIVEFFVWCYLRLQGSKLKAEGRSHSLVELHSTCTWSCSRRSPAML
jgi:hypothetical protein